MIVVALCALAFLMLFFGFEMLLTMGLPAVLAKLAFYPHMPDLVIAQKIMGGVNVSTLLAIPFFVFAADLMAHGVIAEKLTDMVRRLMGHYPGGVGHTTVGSCIMFGAVCGSAPATVAALGRLLFPELTRAGYSEKFALGLIAASAEVALLIPPSITLIIYGWLTGTSIAALFAGGLAVGIVLGIAYMVLVQVETWRCGARPAARPTWGERLRSLGRGFWAIGMPAVILGGIYSGGFTATEAAAVAVVYALVVELWIYRALDWKQVFRIAEESAVTTVIIFVLLAMGSLLSYFITLSDLQNVLVSFIGEHKMNWVMFLLVINAIFFVAGMFIDPNSAQVILIPLLFPIAQIAGVDPVHLGIIVTLNLAIGMYTPPFGLNLFVSGGVFQASYRELVTAVMPFIAVSLVALGLITWIPAISLFIPWLVYGGAW